MGSSSQRGKYAEMAEKITEVAARAIREAVKASQATTGQAKETTKPVKSRKTGK